MTTKFQIISDLHQENIKEPILTRDRIIGDCLLMAGDFTNASYKIDYIKNYNIPSFYVAGNHEFYKQTWPSAIDDYRFYFEGTSIKYMDRDFAIHNGVRIIGTTLWTDFWAPMPDGGPKEYQAAECQRNMNDFHIIFGFSVAKAEAEFYKNVQYLKQVLEHPFEGPTIVMTHHAPSFRSSHPRYSYSTIKGGFCSDLEELIEEYKPEYWIHGHCHESSDYMVGSTRVICNPCGYGWSNPDYKDFIIEV